MAPLLLAAAWLSAAETPRAPAHARDAAAKLNAYSQRVLQDDPELRARLAHLVPLVDAGLRQDGWLAIVDGASYGGRARGVEGVNIAGFEYDAGLERAALTLWHEAQHVYDREKLNALKKRRFELSVIFPLEAEERGWEAGCAFWRSALRQGLADAKGSDPCVPFPARYYACGHDGAVEQTLWAYEPLMNKGETGAEIERRLSAPPPERGAGELRRLVDSFGGSGLHAECFELERALDGNALPAAAPSWSVERCLREAAGAALAPGWRGAMDLCEGVKDDYRRRKTPPRELARRALELNAPR